MTTETLRLTRVHFRPKTVQTNRTGAAAAADVADFVKLEAEFSVNSSKGVHNFTLLL